MPPAALGWWAGRQWDSDSSQSSSASSRSAVPRATSGTGTLDRGGRNLGSRLGRAIDGLFPGPWATTSLTPPELSYCTPRAWDWGAWCQHWALTLWYNKVTAREMYHMVTQQVPPHPHRGLVCPLSKCLSSQLLAFGSSVKDSQWFFSTQ